MYVKCSIMAQKAFTVHSNLGHLCSFILKSNESMRIPITARLALAFSFFPLLTQILNLLS
jgi:hypothetical protein